MMFFASIISTFPSVSTEGSLAYENRFESCFLTLSSPTKAYVTSYAIFASESPLVSFLKARLGYSLLFFASSSGAISPIVTFLAWTKRRKIISYWVAVKSGNPKI